MLPEGLEPAIPPASDRPHHLFAAVILSFFVMFPVGSYPSFFLPQAAVEGTRDLVTSQANGAISEIAIRVTVYFSASLRQTGS